MESRWGEPTGLSQQWGEVEFLLRKPMRNDADIEAAAASAKDGLRFLDELKQLAASLGVLQGSLSRWLLPYVHHCWCWCCCVTARASTLLPSMLTDCVVSVLLVQL